MKDRIQQIIDYKRISAGDLAEILEVQRSNISHILNGRNKPGAVFIEKLLQAFPNVNARWLLTGEGTMLVSNATNEISDTIEQGSDSNKQQKLPSFSDSSSKAPSIQDKSKTIDKIVLLYTDGTFTYYSHQ
jgi:transcriptional regulator with XRE-family HTH domain